MKTNHTYASHVSVLEIDNSALEHNISYFKKKLQTGTKLLGVVKAYSYGHDAIEISKTLEKNDVDYLAVAYTDEGIALRNAGITLPILVLHAQVQNYELLLSYNLEPNIYSSFTLENFIAVAKVKNVKNYPIHLKFNTGLNRLGFTKNDVNPIIATLQDNSHIKIQSVFSHLAASEDANEYDFTKNQIKKFENIRKEFLNAFVHPIDFHLTNTSGIINYPEAHFNMVRLGIGMYGFGNDKNETAQLKNVGTLKTIISQIHEIKPGESLGYNRAFIADKLTKTATLPIGHADGISRELGNKKGCVYIQNIKCPILGNVCMDMIMVDVSQVACKPGDEVIIFDSQEKVNVLATNSNTISYEVITGISQRIARKKISS
ncbi:alanine racemase [Flavicella marina]|uniref:alanine racemase n=1 Tax=Flavicella marina TaxID=1475951 RepID=UPI0012643010|nr:alanine racemase [Flavicella marina]